MTSPTPLHPDRLEQRLTENSPSPLRAREHLLLLRARKTHLADQFSATVASERAHATKIRADQDQKEAATKGALATARLQGNLGKANKLLSKLRALEARGRAQEDTQERQLRQEVVKANYVLQKELFDLALNIIKQDVSLVTTSAPQSANLLRTCRDFAIQEAADISA